MSTRPLPSLPYVTVCQASDRKAWLEARKNLITASDVATVMGLNPYRTRLALLREKAGQTEAVWLDSVPHIRAGRYLEEGVFNWFVADHQASGHLVGALYASVETPCVGATPDGRVFLTDGSGEPVEVKMVGEASRKKWNAGISPTPKSWGSKLPPEPTSVYRFGEPKSSYIPVVGAPLHYWVQLQVQMYVGGDASGWVTGCVGGTSRYDLRYDADAAFVADMRTQCTAFWNEVVDMRANPVVLESEL